jgi:flavin-dependent dehydrogenase
MAERVATIGAGPAGLAAAYELRRTGLDPLVLERGPSVVTAHATFCIVVVYNNVAP